MNYNKAYELIPKMTYWGNNLKETIFRLTLQNEEEFKSSHGHKKDIRECAKFLIVARLARLLQDSTGGISWSRFVASRMCEVWLEAAANIYRKEIQAAWAGLDIQALGDMDFVKFLKD